MPEIFTAAGNFNKIFPCNIQNLNAADIQNGDKKMDEAVKKKWDSLISKNLANTVKLVRANLPAMAAGKLFCR